MKEKDKQEIVKAVLTALAERDGLVLPSEFVPHETSYSGEEGPNFNNLSNAETERLALLIEEMGESLQVVGKILRHGYESYHPKKGNVNNQELLEKELGDTGAAIQRLVEAGDIDGENIIERAMKKLESTGWLHHQ